jgi:hypothetical protein
MFKPAHTNTLYAAFYGVNKFYKMVSAKGPIRRLDVTIGLVTYISFDNLKLIIRNSIGWHILLSLNNISMLR